MKYDPVPAYTSAGKKYMNIKIVLFYFTNIIFRKTSFDYQIFIYIYLSRVLFMINVVYLFLVCVFRVQ